MKNNENTTYYACSMCRTLISKNILNNYINGKDTRLHAYGPFKTLEEAQECYNKKVEPFIDDDDYGIFALRNNIWYCVSWDGGLHKMKY